MWLVRLRMRNARPCARGRKRLSVGPSSTYASCTTSAAGSRSWLFSALATALSSTFPTCTLASCGANLSTACASAAGRPRIRSTTRRAFCGETRTYRPLALALAGAGLASIAVPLLVRLVVSGCCWSVLAASAAARLPVVLLVSAEGAGRRELAELVADHRVGHEHR